MPPSDLLEAPMDAGALAKARAIASLHKQGLPPPEPQAPEAPLPDGVVNHCPFACDNDDLSSVGYCKHLVGFTTNGLTYEPLAKRMRPARDLEGRFLRGEDGKIGFEWDGAWYSDGRNPQEVLKTDKVISVDHKGRPAFSSRVYRSN